jgi:hypothetical protein
MTEPADEVEEETFSQKGEHMKRAIVSIALAALVLGSVGSSDGGRAFNSDAIIENVPGIGLAAKRRIKPKCQNKRVCKFVYSVYVCWWEMDVSDCR